MPKTNAMTEMSTEFLAATMSAQSIGLDMLLAEMRALSEVLPGAVGQATLHSEPVAAADEANFDNMPV